MSLYGFRFCRYYPYPTLYSLSRLYPWEPGWQKAVCGRFMSHYTHEPISDCSCGFYAFSTYTMLRHHMGLPVDLVMLVVEAGGKVQRHTDGWRARYTRALGVVNFVKDAQPSALTAYYYGQASGPLSDAQVIQRWGQAAYILQVPLLDLEDVRAALEV